MKKINCCVFILVFALSASAQKIEYKDGVLKVDGKETAKIKKEKNSGTLGMANNFEISNIKDELLIVAAYSTDFPEDENDNMDYYYKLSFVGLDKTGYFKVSKLGTEKSLAKLIGNGGIIKDDKLDNDAVFKFIAKQGKTPPAPKADYTLVNRDKSWPFKLEEGGDIIQSVAIGKFKDVTPQGSNVDYYEFSLPSGLIVAKVNFTGGNNAKQCEVLTLKDNRKQLVSIPTDDKVQISASSIDRNILALKRIVQWLISNEYL